jgi:hypothetical protein
MAWGIGISASDLSVTSETVMDLFSVQCTTPSAVHGKLYQKSMEPFEVSIQKKMVLRRCPHELKYLPVHLHRIHTASLLYKAHTWGD